MKKHAGGFRAHLQSHPFASAVFGVLAIIFTVTVYLICIGVSPSAARPLAQATALPMKTRISASDIGNRVLIVGLLGYPLGEPVTIEGDLPSKGGRMRLTVTSVNGKQLDTPVRFADPDVSPVFCREEVQGPAREVGDVWELRGIEIGRYRGIPAKVIEEVFPPRSMVPQMSHTFGFYTQILDSSSRVIRHGQRETTTSPSTTAPPRPASKLPPRDTRDPFELE
jgi:hypothetical protein